MIVNEYRYSKEITIKAIECYYKFFTKTQVFHYLSLALAAVCVYLTYTSGLKRFAVFAVIFLLIFLLRYVRIMLASRFDADRMAEECGVADPMMRYEIGDEIKVYRQGKLHIAIPLANIVGCKQNGGDLAVFTKENFTVYLKDGAYLEGGATAVKSLIRGLGANVK